MNHTCPKCNAVAEIPDYLSGSKTRCPRCGAVSMINAQEPDRAKAEPNRASWWQRALTFPVERALALLAAGVLAIVGAVSLVAAVGLVMMGSLDGKWPPWMVRTIVGGLGLGASFLAAAGALAKPKRKPLAERAKKAGAMKGKTKGQLIAALGPPRHVYRTASSETWTWGDGSYTIRLGFQGDICDGVLSEEVFNPPPG